MSTFAEVPSIRPKRIWEGVQARIVQGDRITMAVVEIEPNQVVPEHQHENEQLGFVISGSITFTVGGETRECGPGGTWRILANVPHQARVGPEGAVVAEVYSPVRADWAALDADDDAGEVRWPAP